MSEPANVASNVSIFNNLAAISKVGFLSPAWVSGDMGLQRKASEIGPLAYSITIPLVPIVSPLTRMVYLIGSYSV